MVNTSVINRNIHSLYLNFCGDVNWCFCYYLIHVEGKGLKQKKKRERNLVFNWQTGCTQPVQTLFQHSFWYFQNYYH